MSNSMLDILKNFNDASTGKKVGLAGQSKNEMKSILESFYNVSNKSVAVEECGGMPTEMGMSMGQMPSPEEDKVTMNVSLNARGADAIADLIKLMGGSKEQHVDMPMAHDAHIDTDSHNVGEPDMAAMRKAMVDIENGKDSELESEVEEWANSPEGSETDEEYQDLKYMTKDLSGGINREKPKGSERAKDPAVVHAESIKAQLWAALNEKKMSKKKDVKAAEGEQHGNSKIYDKCWDGYRRVPGKKRGEKGSCVKK